MKARPRYIDAVLRIVADPKPAGHYACLLCPYTESVRGREKTTAFAATVRTAHRATCPGQQTSPHASHHRTKEPHTS